MFDAITVVVERSPSQSSSVARSDASASSQVIVTVFPGARGTSVAPPEGQMCAELLATSMNVEQMKKIVFIIRLS